MNKFPRKYLNSKEEGYYLMLEVALAYINGETEEGGVKSNSLHPQLYIALPTTICLVFSRV